MSQSRAERRRGTRGGATPPPKKRDPMIGVYIGFILLIVLVFVGFGISNFFQNRAHEQALAFDNSTPSPAPSPASTSKPVQLHDLQPIGTLMGIPKPDLQKNVLADTSTGGRGQPVDGIPCQAEMVQVHVHSHLAIFVNGKQAQVPGFIGITPTPTGGCLYWLHTHGPDGIIHVEAVTAQAPNGGPYTLGNLFDIWGQPLTRNQVGPYNGNVTAFVNNAPYDGDLRSIPLRSHQQVVLEVGSPVVPPPTYRFPPND